ncbi:MAG: ABC transporter transmembrane domain-containing protein, partial [Firmicutes bacterium]|nr:ABC transporter transmembrane domain-containing protein [Bacillota bacterium]
MRIIIRIIKGAKKWRVQLFIATVTLFLVTAINLATPLAVKRLFALIAEDGGGKAMDIWIIAAGLLGLYLFRVLCQFLNNYCAHIAAWYSVADTRVKLYSHLQTLSMSYYSDKQTGQLMSRVIEDTANFEMLVAHSLPEFITSVLTFAGVFAIMFILNPVLAAFTCIPLPLIVFISVFARRMHKHFSRRQVISAELNAMLQDNFSGMKEIQIFNREEYEGGKVAEKAKMHAAQTMKGIFWVSTMFPLLNLLSGLGTLIVIFAGGLFALNGNLVAADITVFLLYLGLFYAPVASFARIIEDIQSALVSGKRVFSVMDTKSDIADGNDAVEVTRLNGNVEFKNVSFDYTADIAVLRDVSF